MQAYCATVTFVQQAITLVKQMAFVLLQLTLSTRRTDQLHRIGKLNCTNKITFKTFSAWKISMLNNLYCAHADVSTKTSSYPKRIHFSAWMCKWIATRTSSSAAKAGICAMFTCSLFWVRGLWKLLVSYLISFTLNTTYNEYIDIIFCRTMSNRFLQNCFVIIVDADPQAGWFTSIQVAIVSIAAIILLALLCFLVVFCVQRKRLHCKGAHYVEDMGVHQHNEKLLSAFPEATTSTSGSGELFL